MNKVGNRAISVSVFFPTFLFFSSIHVLDFSLPNAATESEARYVISLYFLSRDCTRNRVILRANLGVVSKPANEGQEAATADNCLAVQHCRCRCRRRRSSSSRPVRSLRLHDACIATRSEPLLSTSARAATTAAAVGPGWLVDGSTCRRCLAVGRHLVASRLPSCPQSPVPAPSAARKQWCSGQQRRRLQVARGAGGGPIQSRIDRK